MSRVYRVFSVTLFVILAYSIGILTGYVLGYNDNYADKVVKYRMTHRVRSR